MNRRTERAFTVVELMIVIVIIGALSVVGIASFARQSDARAVRAASADVLRLMQELRSRALTTNRAVVMTVVANGTEGQSTITWSESPNNLCGGALTVAGTLVFDPANPVGPMRNVSIMRAEPAATATMRMCFLPNGRVVEPATARPFAPLTTGALGGRAYLELAPLDCTSGVCVALPYQMTLALGLNGLGEEMAPEFRIP
jgi:prepilin-type N-terminal cleavage/methylation domain-containing protein